MNTLEIEKLKAGDRVGFCRFGNWGDIQGSGFGTVKKVNGRGDVTVAVAGVEPEITKTFSKYGRERGDKHFGHELWDAADLAERIEGQNERRRTNRAVKEMQEGIEKLLRSYRSGMGDYHVDDEVRRELFALVNLI